MERWAKSSQGRGDYRIVASPTFKDTLYVFVYIPRATDSADDYRELRQDYLRDYCFLVHSQNRRFRRVIGIATDAGDEPYRTFDVVLLEGSQWTKEMEDLAREIRRELGVAGQGTIHRITDPPPGTARGRRTRQRKNGRVGRNDPFLDLEEGHRRGLQRKNGRVGRNDPCPCQSGKKYKHCCLRSERD